MCAIFYAENSKHLRFKVLPDNDRDLQFVKEPIGVKFFLTPVVPTWMGIGCPNDANCRTLIAKHTGTPILNADADRCVVIDWSGTVINKIKADPELDDPPQGLEGYIPIGHRIILHREADLGDRSVDGIFYRRHIIVHKETGIAAQIQWLPVHLNPQCEPDYYSVWDFTAQVGDKLPLIKSVRLRSKYWLTLLSSVAPIGTRAA